MRRFQSVVAAYCVACLIAAIAIVLRGDGPHPRVVEVYPSRGNQYWPGGTAQITFSQAMNQSSVERALQVSPGGQGQAAWYGNTLNLQPVGDWKPNVTYHVVLRGSVMDDQDRPLRTPVSLWFRVHHVRNLVTCRVAGVPNVCEPLGSRMRPLTHSPEPVSSYTLSPDGSLVAYLQRDHSTLTHLFVIGVDGTQARQLTSGYAYADSHPTWIPGNSSSIAYFRRPLSRDQGHSHLGQVQTWIVHIDGSSNFRLS